MAKKAKKKKKNVEIPMSAAARIERKRILARKFTTIRELAEALIKSEHHKDSDGRVIGWDYGHIHRDVLRRFPTVRSSGPHRGRPTKMPVKELHEIACELNRNGVKLPFRPRRRTGRNKAKTEQHS